ncbi:hypothetical protein ERW49_19040 [Aliivibrio finisterrensis]|uniref:LRAT domain-containing protein n=2 Tax=Vibrionaceae TaxID=641 RepID=A0A4Q5K3E0_9GAMM|nr:hypothetical protein ERW49_19040 [Aliivibrio finisterrensis]
MQALCIYAIEIWLISLHMSNIHNIRRNLLMDFNSILPGDFLVTDFNFGPFPYQHWSLVSDKKCSNGYYMLISASERTKTVQEESVEIVTQGGNTYKANIIPNISVEEIILNAREQIGVWKYSVTDRNCQHFVNFVSGLGLTSEQVKVGMAAGIVGGLATTFLSEKPTWYKILGVAVACAGIGVAGSKATAKKEDA